MDVKIHIFRQKSIKYELSRVANCRLVRQQSGNKFQNLKFSITIQHGTERNE